MNTLHTYFGYSPTFILLFVQKFCCHETIHLKFSHFSDGRFSLSWKRFQHVLVPEVQCVMHSFSGPSVTSQQRKSSAI